MLNVNIYEPHLLEIMEQKIRLKCVKTMIKTGKHFFFCYLDTYLINNKNLQKNSNFKIIIGMIGT